MGVRINKVLNELNIGLQTAIDFLKQKRQLGEVRDDMTPNTKISDEQYEALVKQFGVDKSVKKQAEALFKKQIIILLQAQTTNMERVNLRSVQKNRPQTVNVLFHWGK